MMRRILIVFAVFAMISCKTTKTALNNTIGNETGLDFIQTKNGSFYDSRQIISIIEIKKKKLNKYTINLEYEKTNLLTTSAFANRSDGIAAINGGFFNMDNGGSVRYLEKNDSVITWTPKYGPKWTVSDSLMNGAIIIDKHGKMFIEAAKQDSLYFNSSDENMVLVTGPLLIMDYKEVILPDKQFVTKRHPRTCLCETNSSYILIAIDGRNPNAEGMNLYEVQDFMKSHNCITGINLDGGGSTTMWLKGMGVVNHPSDKTGERTVANALVIKNK